MGLRRGERLTRIGIISAYPDEDWDARRIAEAAERHGHVELLAPTDFGAVVGDEPSVTVRGEDARLYDVILTPRAIGEEGDAELQIELYRALAEMGVPTVNEVGALMVAIDKFRSSWLFAAARLPTPEVVVAQRLEEACRALARMRCAVVKPLYGSLGIGVERITVEDAAHLRELLERHGALYLQRYVPEADDVRAFVVGGRVEAAIRRRARAGEFRANIHQGSSFEEIALDRFTAEVAVRATATIGLDYAGVDLLVTDDGPCVLEVNGTPSFRGVNQATGRDMAEPIVRHAIARCTTYGRRERGNGEQGTEGRHERSRGRPQRRREGRADHQGALRHALLSRDRPQRR